MIKRVNIENYRSFVKASANLSPITLVIGANGAGKSNFARLFADITVPISKAQTTQKEVKYAKHFNLQTSKQKVEITTEKWDDIDCCSLSRSGLPSTKLYKLNPSLIGQPEQIKPGPVGEDASNIVSVLDGLKNGDREDLFDEIESFLIQYIPSIEKLSSKIHGTGQKMLQVRERHIKQPFPVSQLSEGTRLLLSILTIVHQEHPPKLIVLEDIDYGLHPRLFGELLENLKDIVEVKGLQIIATTHNPYVVDQFKDNEEAVLIIEKKDGESTIVSLADRIEENDSLEASLGELWFGGFVGGIPNI